MDNFDKSIKTILIHEGGYTNDPIDPGGATNFGISLRWLAQKGLIGDMDGDGDVDAEDIKLLSTEKASELYRIYWWDKYKYYNIIDDSLATKIFDMSVNMGPVRAHKIVQQSINKVISIGINGFSELKVDGIFGPKTLSAVNSLAKLQLIPEIRENQKKFYLRLIARNHDFEKYRTGWIRRAMA